jgi:secreted trypsin-like serine protease
MILCMTRSNATLCGGSIIANQWILTAGHCLLTETYDIYKDCTVSLGKHYLHLPTAEATEQSFSIIEYAVQDQYNHKDIEAGYDFALVRLSRPIKYTKEVLPICLPFDQPDPNPSTMCFSGGWGYTEGQKVSPSKVLKQINMPVQSDNYCSYTTKSAQAGIIICAGKWDRKQDLCYGDSGGPLHCKTDSRWYLFGVLSQVDKQCVSVASFGKVKKFQDWIESHVGKS